MIPDTICGLSNLQEFYVTYGPGNAEVMCFPACLSSVANLGVPPMICPSYQDNGLCGFIESTNIQYIDEYSMWSCSNLGIITSSACSWNGVSCSSGGNVVSIDLGGIELFGKN